MEKKNLKAFHLVHVIRGETEQTHKLTHGVSLLEGLLDTGVDISHSCGGNASCGTCQIKVLFSSAVLKPRNELESEMATDRGFQEDERLACQLEVSCELKIKIP